MAKKKPNNYAAPLVIAGVTIGFLTAGYKLAFGKKKSASTSKNPTEVPHQPK